MEHYRSVANKNKNQYIQPLTLGEFIEKLRQQPQDNEITFDFCGFLPTTFDSWRGVYCELALGYEAPEYNKSIQVATLLSRAQDADGEVFMGYKGGNYQMGKSTRIWVDNRGETNGTAIVDVITFDTYLTKIITQYFNTI